MQRRVKVHVINTDKTSTLAADSVVCEIPNRRMCLLSELSVGDEALVSDPLVLDDSPSVDHVRVLEVTS